MNKGLLTLFISLALLSLLFAGGFSLYEFGARSSAMGGAVVAHVPDASAIFYNPAGLGFLEGTQFYGGVTLIFPSGNFVGAQPIFPEAVFEMTDNIFTPVGIYIAHKFGDRISAGIGLTNPFGLGVEWEKKDVNGTIGFPGRFVSQNVDLRSFYISPVIALKISPNLSIGGGADLVISDVTLERSVNIFDSEGSIGYEVGTVKLEATTGITVGFSASLMYRYDNFGFGFMYRHSVENDFDDGKAKFEIFDNLSVPNIAVLASQMLTDQKGTTTITYPNFFSTGIFYKFFDRLGLEVDYTWYNWSKFDKIVLKFESLPEEKIDENYEDSFEIRVGAQFDVNENLSLRAGYIFDQTPQPIESVSPLLPDDDRSDFSIGLGYKLGKVQLDAGYMFVDIGERTTVENGVGKSNIGLNGTYNSQASLAFFSIGVNWK